MTSLEKHEAARKRHEEAVDWYAAYRRTGNVYGLIVAAEVANEAFADSMEALGNLLYTSPPARDEKYQNGWKTKE